jgi:sugar lactone lactonase YvrE
MKSKITFLFVACVLSILCSWENSYAQLVSTFAGSGSQGSANGTGTAASFNLPFGGEVDSDGNIYIADMANHLIRKITPSGVVTTFAGSGSPGSTDGSGTSASFNEPTGIAIDATNNLYVADSKNHKIRKITPFGVVSTFAGTGIKGYLDGTSTSSNFDLPYDLVFDASGNLFVVEYEGCKIRKITPSGTVSRLAGSGAGGSADGTGSAATFSYPLAITIDPFGNLYVADSDLYKIRKVTSTGVVTSIAGALGSAGDADGPGSSARFNTPAGLASDIAGNIYVADVGNHKIRKISTTGIVTSVAGAGTSGNQNGLGTTAKFNGPVGLFFGGNNSLYVTDMSNHSIRKIALLPEIKISQGSTELLSGSDTYNFGSVNALSSSAAVTFSIENLASAEGELSLTGSPKISISGAHATEFSVNTTSTTSPVAVGSSTNFTITFLPTSGGSKSATVTVLNDDVDEGTYTFTVTGTGLKINQSISGLSNISAAYGDAPLNLSATSSSGLTLSYSSSNTNVATVSGNVLTVVGAGTSTITASQAGNATYNAAANSTATLTVSKAFLTIVADNKTKVEGASNPPLTITYSGFVDSDNETVLGCIPVPQTTATTSSPAGNYPITVSNCGFTNTNYNYTFSGGTLTVTTATSTFEESEGSLFTVSPNPSNGQLLLEAKEAMQVKVFNANGIIVFENNFQQGTHTISLDLLESGFYFIRVLNSDGKAAEKLIIKN